MSYVRARSLWGAKPPRGPVTHDDWKRNPITLVVHHTAGYMPLTEDAAKRELRSIQQSHMSGSRGEPFNDIGYNYLIDRLGRWWEGRGWGIRGAHTLSHNTNTVGISFMMNGETTKLTVRQKYSYYRLVRKLQKQGLRLVAIRNHKDMPGQATACPGKHIAAQLKFTNRLLLRKSR